jgi:16S rRNA (uracil1498-N3)-methyltransferase
VLTPAESHYLRHVLRLAAGTRLEVFDGQGGVYPALLGEHEELEVGPRREAASPAARVQLAFALARSDRCDLVVQKATEIGAARLSPFPADRSVVRLDGPRGAERARRWQRIAAEAARQCGRSDVPPVDPPTPLGELLAAAGPEARIVVPYEAGGEPFHEAVDRSARGHLVVVGPEGGFTPGEIELCLRHGGRLATLGPRILRFETAAIVACALVEHLAGDLGGREL